MVHRGRRSVNWCQDKMGQQTKIKKLNSQLILIDNSRGGKIPIKNK